VSTEALGPYFLSPRTISTFFLLRNFSLVSFICTDVGSRHRAANASVIPGLLVDLFIDSRLW
jgi:hypothetical protein